MMVDDVEKPKGFRPTPQILVVDDDHRSFEVMRAFLSEVDAEVETAESAEAALDWVKAHPFHGRDELDDEPSTHELAMVILDVRLPGMDGFELAGKLFATDVGRHAPFLFISGVKRDPSSIYRGYDIGAMDYLIKPVDIEILRSKVNVCLALFDARQDLMSRQRRLLDANERLRDFNYTASHDLRAPLRQIRTFVTFIKEDEGEGLTAPSHNHLQYILDAADRLEQLVGGMLHYTNKAMIKPSSRTISLTTVLSVALRNHADTIKECNADVHLDSFPSIKGNATMLVEAFSSIIDNALKYRREDAPPRIDIISAKGEPDRHTIVIRDNGVGFDPELVRTVFAPFRKLRADGNAKGVAGGFGVGLAIARNVIEEHGGTITVDTAPGEGSSFIVAFPKGTE